MILSEGHAGNMKRKIWLLVIVFGIFSVSTCGPAIPSETVLPTSGSPSPVPLIFLSPATIAVVPTSECNQNPPVQPKGSLVHIEFGNQTGGGSQLFFWHE